MPRYLQSCYTYRQKCNPLLETTQYMTSFRSFTCRVLPSSPLYAPFPLPKFYIESTDLSGLLATKGPAADWWLHYNYKGSRQLGP